MVFKRRTPKSYWQSVVDFIYPRTGYRRALSYLALRLKRLPDSPGKIARGIAAGVFVTFTPFYFFHFFLAAFVAVFLRGNIFAAIIATFFGNPFTFPFIAYLSYRLGIWMLGMRIPGEKILPRVWEGLGDVGWPLWQNFKSLFGAEYIGWDRFADGLVDVFLPYLIGGLLPGAITAFGTYYFARPIIAAFQARRKGVVRKRLAERLEAAKQKSEDKAALRAERREG